jgi:hypothetical protein
MWFNGTELTAKARRALENENVTIVAHSTGYIHTIYDSATISPDVYSKFNNKLNKYLKTDINFEILANFLRHHSEFQKCFQISHICCGKPRYIEAEKVYQYEHSSKSRVGDSTQNKLLHEIEEDDFYTSPLPQRIMLSDLEAFFKSNHISLEDSSTVDKLKLHLCNNCLPIDRVIENLKKFCKTVPNIPDSRKKWQSTPAIDLNDVKSAEDVIAKMKELRKTNLTADLAFSAFRDLKNSPWKPFLKAALQRNPVSINQTTTMSVNDTFNRLCTFDNSSIYPGESRLAQPDEVWNFQRGDGLEKAICLINILKNRYPDDLPHLKAVGKKIFVIHKTGEFQFQSSKDVEMPQQKDF